MIGIYLLAITTEMLKYILIFHGLLGFSYRKGIHKYALMLFASIAFGLFHFIPGVDTLYLSLIIILINFITTLFLYAEKIGTLTKVFIAISFVIVTWDSLFIKAINFFFIFDETITSGALLQQSLCNIILIIILALIWVSVKHLGLLHKLNYNQLSNTVYFLFLSSIVLNAYIISVAFIFSESSNKTKTSLTYTSMMLLSILFQAISIALIFLFFSREQYKTLNRLREEYNEKQIDYYKTLLTQEEDTRKFRHDIKNHFICIEELLDTGKAEEAQTYIRDIHDSLEKITGIYDTGNDIINAIINYYAKIGREDHIVIRVKGRILQDLNIPSMHLSTIVSNLMSNAYEASAKLDCSLDKIISVEIRAGSKYLEFIIKNPTVEDRKKLDDKFLTSKADRKNHGFGIQNIREILLKYEGELQFKDEINCVTVRVTMKIV
jgi:signal transduction histidine kinase